jgi:ATP-dependent DNA helicase RecG
MTLWRDWLTPDVLDSLGLNERQQKAITKVKITGRISNSEYQELTGAIKKTSTRDLDDLVTKGALVKIGRTGRGTYYILAGKGTKRGQTGHTTHVTKGVIKGTKGPWNEDK